MLTTRPTSANLQQELLNIRTFESKLYVKIPTQSLDSDWRWVASRKGCECEAMFALSTSTLYFKSIFIVVLFFADSWRLCGWCTDLIICGDVCFEAEISPRGSCLGLASTVWCLWSPRSYISLLVPASVLPRSRCYGLVLASVWDLLICFASVYRSLEIKIYFKILSLHDSFSLVNIFVSAAGSICISVCWKSKKFIMLLYSFVLLCV